MKIQRWKRLWVIRHIRWFWLAYRLARWVEHCQRHNIGFVAQESDLEYLEDVWNGRQ